MQWISSDSIRKRLEWKGTLGEIFLIINFNQSKNFYYGLKFEYFGIKIRIITENQPAIKKSEYGNLLYIFSIIMN